MQSMPRREMKLPLLREKLKKRNKIVSKCAVSGKPPRRKDYRTRHEKQYCDSYFNWIGQTK